ncbi:MAG: exonuclease subunit SbcD [Sphaerochaetaceae bacterium]|nr:exonuclease subunit SbcD [Sphaerochaetaceae bacterium]
MKVLHTSDLHIGKNLHKHRINFAHEHFFDYLINKLITDKIDLLLISGDIFDTSYVSVSTQKVFYDFLERLTKIKTLKDTVIISGNHDLSSMLDLASPFLERHHIHIITSINIEDQIFTLKYNNIPYCNIVAIPFLREKDIKPDLESNDIVDIPKELEQALVDHYRKVDDYIEKNLDLNLPTISLMHLFTSGSSTITEIEGEKQRDIYVGKLKSINANTFPKNIDYFALGHIHKPQIVNNDEKIVYSGSPISLNFGEKTPKQIIKLTFEGKSFTKEKIKLPKFLNLEQINASSIEDIEKQLNKLALQLEVEYKDDPIFLEIIYNSKNIETSINEKVEDLVKGLNNNFKILIIRLENKITLSQAENKRVSLDMLSPKQIFDMTFVDSQSNRIEDEEIIDLFLKVVDEVENEAK